MDDHIVRRYIAYYTDGQTSQFRANGPGMRDLLGYIKGLEERDGLRVTHIVPLHGVSPTAEKQ